MRHDPRKGDNGPGRAPVARGAWRLWLLAAGVFAAGSMAPAAATTLDARSLRSAALVNGLRVVVCEDADSPASTVEVVIKIGSADDPTGRAGLAHLLEHVCWAGRGERDRRQRIEGLGGVTGAAALRDFTRFYATVPSDDWPLAMQTLAEVVLQEGFSEAIVARERRVIAQEALGRQGQPRLLLNELAFETLYGADHPYGRPIEGDGQSLAEISAAALSHFHRSWYVPNNMALIVAGDVEFDSVMREIEAVFGGLSPRALPPRAAADSVRPAPGGARELESRLSDAHVMAAFLGPAAEEWKAVCASDVFATLLAHGNWGQLVAELKEKRGLVKDIGVDFLTQRGHALFGIWMVCSNANVSAAQEALRAELLRLAEEPVEPKQLAAAKRLLSAGYAFANETAADRAATVGFYEAIDSYRAASSYLPRVAAVSSGDLAAVAARYAGEPTWVVIRAGEGAE